MLILYTYLIDFIFIYLYIYVILKIFAVYTMFDHNWKRMNSFFLGVFGVGAIVLLGVDLANLNGNLCLFHLDFNLRFQKKTACKYIFLQLWVLPGSLILAAVIATSAMVATATKLAFWTSEKKGKAFTYLLALFIGLLLVQTIAVPIQVSYSGIFFSNTGMHFSMLYIINTFEHPIVPFNITKYNTSFADNQGNFYFYCTCFCNRTHI